MKRIKPQYFLILLLVAALAAAPFLIRGLIDRSSVGKQPAASVTAAPEGTAEPTPMYGHAFFPIWSSIPRPLRSPRILTMRSSSATRAPLVLPNTAA